MATRVPLILGGSAFGAAGTLATRIHELPECQQIVDYFVENGHNVIDTSSVYGNGTSEEYIAQLDIKGARVDTKCYPEAPGDHAPERLRAIVQHSVKVLSPHKIRVLYLHAPDRTVSYEETLREVNELYKEGLFEEFGLSNFPSWEVAEFVAISKHNNWIQPTVYQGGYNALERNVEIELFPCLRKYGIRFFAFSPLARGLIAGTNIFSPPPGSRWDLSSSSMAAGLQKKYKSFQPVFDDLEKSLSKYNITPAEAALRWIQHHSLLTPEDAVLIGGSSLRQMQANIKASEGGPLPEDIVQVLNEAYVTYQGHLPPYFR